MLNNRILYSHKTLMAFPPLFLHYWACRGEGDVGGGGAHTWRGSPNLCYRALQHKVETRRRRESGQQTATPVYG